ncbi:hypothetical protein [uncultured Cytophaga sp.]|uniref:hypothetical protein n=1 Tax=uncultured Cytophaga sp. TaxID=160238 RepID=UPI0026233DD1|nr:hypothetical protein [uncultured Cytophaga sp.]
MTKNEIHTFHIPVMGIGYTIDSPVKVARYGISSVVSIIEDHVIERLREYYTQFIGQTYVEIKTNEVDYRARRITSYLNILDTIVSRQFDEIKSQSFSGDSDIVKYFEMLPDSSPLKALYVEMDALDGEDKFKLQEVLRTRMAKGCIDVNIMTKLDRVNYDAKNEAMAPEFNDAMAALRGFANSTVEASVIFSAGMNPRLYTYCENFRDFYPSNNMRKKIVIKVSDYRSALVQGKIFAKKGLWVSEFRIESGLNCGGHAFATDGLLMGPILEQFKNNRESLYVELIDIYKKALSEKGEELNDFIPSIKISVQGGVGTNQEQELLLDYYNVDSVGWGSPFLLVPEATDVDQETLSLLEHAKKEDYYLSNASPLGVPFNNVRNTSSDKQRKKRIEDGKSGSPCYLKFLSFNTEFTEKPICTASLKYQGLKIAQLQGSDLKEEDKKSEIDRIQELDCLCSGLGVSTLLVKKEKPMYKLSAVTICPGPNLAYFSGVFTLKEMVGHIYGRNNLLNDLPRPHVFINELNIYVDYLKNEINKCKLNFTAKQITYFNTFKNNLCLGIDYYAGLKVSLDSKLTDWLEAAKLELNNIQLA